jgi:hypothetical protein
MRRSPFSPRSATRRSPAWKAPAAFKVAREIFAKVVQTQVLVKDQASHRDIPEQPDTSRKRHETATGTVERLQELVIAFGSGDEQDEGTFVGRARRLAPRVPEIGSAVGAWATGRPGALFWRLESPQVMKVLRCPRRVR